MELLAPAGNIEKLRTAYQYGADAAYIGVSGFSLRSRSSELDLTEQAQALKRIKGGNRLYGALNIYFHDQDIRRLREMLDGIAHLPLDALIVSDIGLVELLQERMPNVELHLSTQANCLNAPAARLYHKLGFSRIVPAREMSLEDIARLKDAVPELEVEAFVHGAMCLAYSGRCLLSAWETGRSANKGECSHSCRWEYQTYVEEAKRPGEYMPVDQTDGHTTIMSPRDLCMIDYLEEFSRAGVDALKIEGRMKSRYYLATVTRAYRKELDRIQTGKDPRETERFRQELENVSHREFSTGFYFNDPKATLPTTKSYSQRYRFMGAIGEELGNGRFRLLVKNSFSVADPIELVGPDQTGVRDLGLRLYSESETEVADVTHHSTATVAPSIAVSEGWLIRMPIEQNGTD